MGPLFQGWIQSESAPVAEVFAIAGSSLLIGAAVSVRLAVGTRPRWPSLDLSCCPGGAQQSNRMAVVQLALDRLERVMSIILPLSTATIDAGPLTAKCTTVAESGIRVPASSTASRSRCEHRSSPASAAWRAYPR